jgi:3-oxoacyl-[acyl-carrier protein] reductase
MTNPMSLQDRVIMITGGGQGIGRALAEFSVSMGARVALIDIDRAIAESAAAEIGTDQVRAYAGDVTDESFVKETVSAILRDLGGLHGLINNAGIVRAAMLHKMTLREWKQVIDVNLTGSFVCLQAVASHWIEQSKQGVTRPGSIVNVSSVAGKRGTIGQINYGAAKSGVLGLTMSAARELGRYNINVNSVCYGAVETAMTETIRQEKYRDKYLQQIPLGRFSLPTEVAPATCFLLSEAAAYITGQHLSVDGGMHMTA